MRNALALVPKGAQQMVAATIRTVFLQPDAESARSTWRRVADGFRPRWPRLAQLLDTAEEEVLTYLAFPQEHWRQVWSTDEIVKTAAVQAGDLPSGDHRRCELGLAHAALPVGCEASVLGLGGGAPGAVLPA
jgi:Transposase, Mutator family